MATKDRITCHILDTAQGRPAAGVRVRLELTAPLVEPAAIAHAAATATAPVADSLAAAGSNTALGHHYHGQATQVFESQTNDDGRVTAWLPYSASNASGEVPVYTLDDVLEKVETEAKQSAPAGSTPPPTTWTLRFDIEGYYGAGEAFFPEVAVTFRVNPGQHYHVPLLLSPFSYTTYRGS